MLLAAALAAALVGAADLAEEAPRAVTLPAVTIANPVDAVLHFDTEPGIKVNAKAPRRLRVGERKVRIPAGPAPVTFTVSPADAVAHRLKVETEYYVCTTEPDAPCYLRAVHFEIPLRPGKDALRHLELRTPRSAGAP